MESRYFIVTSGATGAGKTKLIEKTLVHLGINDQPYVKILVDDLVETDLKYKAIVSDIIQDVLNKCSSKQSVDVVTCEKEAYDNPTDELYDKFREAYFIVRGSTGCHGLPKSCNELNDENIENAIKNNENVVFEFTGSYIPTWLFDPKYIPSNYKIVMAYSLVTLTNLIQRNKSRAYDSVQSFKTDNQRPAPRLPNVSPETFQEVVSKIYQTLMSLYETCILNYDLDTCGKNKINQLILFDNNGRDLQLSFDSALQQLNKNEFNALIMPSFGMPEPVECGTTRRTKRGTKRRSKRGHGSKRGSKRGSKHWRAKRRTKQ